MQVAAELDKGSLKEPPPGWIRPGEVADTMEESGSSGDHHTDAASGLYGACHLHCAACRGMKRVFLLRVMACIGRILCRDVCRQMRPAAVQDFPCYSMHAMQHMLHNVIVQ